MKKSRQSKSPNKNRRLPKWPIAKTADELLGSPEINLLIPHILSVIDSKYSCLVFCVFLCVLFNSECSRSIYVPWPIRLTVIAPCAIHAIHEF